MKGDRMGFRYGLGLLVIIGGMAGYAALCLLPIPAGNRDAVMLALGIILGWGSSVVGFEFGSSPSERKAATAGAEQAAGTSADPVNIKEVKTHVYPPDRPFYARRDDRQ